MYKRSAHELDWGPPFYYKTTFLSLETKIIRQKFGGLFFLLYLCTRKRKESVLSNTEWCLSSVGRASD